ncbi:exonuclease domain-containing protein [Mobilicoccus massiliensis]|uniref:exonuclease domain-containing protein n=1 Tax=Mobilicoccus massiliensis TaxID=1522310 RepID=UPI00159648B6|nr:exonuclease domain-containing protein [Mobilicoccus massiliensis]
MTGLVSVVVLLVVLLVLFRMFAADSPPDATAEPAPTPPPESAPRSPASDLRPHPDEAANSAGRAAPATRRRRSMHAGAPPPDAAHTAPRHGRTRLFGLGGTDLPGGIPHTGPYAVIGYTTTGFTPVRDRIVSLAVLHVDAQGGIEGRYTTLLSAETAAIPPHLSELAARLHEAPSFARVAPHLLALLEGRVVLAHHAEFLEQLLDAHLMEAGVLAPSMPALCTFTIGRTTFPTRNHRLPTLARQVEATAVVGRSALDDAYATAALLPAILLRHGSSLRYPCAAAGDPEALVLPGADRSLSPAGERVDPWLDDLFARASGLARELNDTRVGRFLDVLVPLLLQGRIVADEVRGLTRLMVAAGYGAAELRQIQERLLESLRRAAFERKRIGTRALRHLRATATSVGIPTYFDDLVPPEAPPAPEPGSGSFSRPVRKPLPPAPPAHLPRCGHCLEIGHYTSACPRREQGPVRAIAPI